MPTCVMAVEVCGFRHERWLTESCRKRLQNPVSKLRQAAALPLQAGLALLILSDGTYDVAYRATVTPILANTARKAKVMRSHTDLLENLFIQGDAVADAQSSRMGEHLQVIEQAYYAYDNPLDRWGLDAWGPAGSEEYARNSGGSW